MKQVILDANVVISGAIAPLGRSAAILDAWRAGAFELVTCPALVEEVAEKLNLPRIRKKYPLTDDQLAALRLSSDRPPMSSPAPRLSILLRPTQTTQCSSPQPSSPAPTIS